MTLEDLFIREFRQEISGGDRNIYGIPLPNEVHNWYVSGTDLFLVQCIEDEVYGRLNGQVVEKIKSGVQLTRRSIDKATRSLAKDENGNFIRTNASIPSGSTATLSAKDIKKPFRYKNPKGFDYVDYTRDRVGNVKYCYCIPNKNLYKINQTALVLSIKDMKNYNGKGYYSWEHGKIFLHIVPYNPRAKYVGSIVLRTKVGLNYAEEISYLLRFWQKSDVIPNIKLSTLEDGRNLVVYPTTTGYISYTAVEELPLSDKEEWKGE